MSSVAFENKLPANITGTDAGLHVVHLIEALCSGGAERLLYTNLKHFDRTRIRSTVMTVYPHARHWLNPIQDLGIQVISLNCDSPRDLPSAIKNFRGWLRQHQPDLIHSHLWAANVVARVAGRLERIPVLSSIHNPDHEPQVWDDGANVSRAKRWASKAIDRWTSWFGSTRLLAVSDYVRHSAHKSLHCPMFKIDLLYNPIDTGLLSSPVARDRTELLRQCGLPEDALLLLNVGRISPQKGLLYAVRALPRILERHANAHLVSVGATIDRDWVTRLTDEARIRGVEDHFHLVGARSDVADFLYACDVFVFPSLYEGLGIALIEAMAAGCLCVATDAGPIPEYVEHGSNGMLVPPKNPEALAMAVCELLADPQRARQMSSAAKRTALSRFQPQAAADKLTEIYEKIATMKTSATQ